MDELGGRAMRGKFIKQFIILAFCGFSIPLTTFAQQSRSSLALGDRNGSPNTSISVPVQIYSNQGLVGIQFDVIYNPLHFDIAGVTPFPSLSTDHLFVDKALAIGQHRFLVYSATNTEFEDDVIGDLELNLSASFPEGVAALSFSNISFVKSNGEVLTVAIAPFVKLTAPTESVNLNQLDSLDFSAIAIATDGAVTQVEFQAQGNTVAVATESPFAATWTADIPGNVFVNAIAVDSDGDIGTSICIEITVTPTSFPFLDDWILQEFTAEQRNDPATINAFADPEKDGIINLLEYAFGLKPLVDSQDGLPVLEIVEEAGEQYLALRYQKPVGITALSYTVETYREGSGWSSDSSRITQTVLESIDGVEKIRALSLDPIVEESDLIRIRIEIAQ